jgi:phospho-acceptor domain-containing protein
MIPTAAPHLFRPGLEVELLEPKSPSDIAPSWPHLHVRDIGHGLNNLLSVIGGYTEMMLAKLEENHPMREMLEEIKTASDRAAILSNQLIAICRKHGGSA